MPKTEKEDSKAEAPLGNQLATPAGLVPVSAKASSKEEAEKLLKAQAERGEAEKSPKAGDRLSDELIRKLSSAELRAIALFRGYTLRGRRISADSFLAQQADDSDLREPPKKAAD